MDCLDNVGMVGNGRVWPGGGGAGAFLLIMSPGVAQASQSATWGGTSFRDSLKLFSRPMVAVLAAWFDQKVSVLEEVGSDNLKRSGKYHEADERRSSSSSAEHRSSSRLATRLISPS